MSDPDLNLLLTLDALLAEGSVAARVAGLGTGLGSVRGTMTGAGFDGTGERADRWIGAPVARNPMSRACVIDELYLAATSPAATARASALAHALICAGAVLHVVEHFSWHTGQVVWIAKARAGAAHGLAFYDDAAVNAARNASRID